MINKIRYLNNKNGFTLVEILVVIVIMGIVFSAASNLFISGYNFYIQSEERATIQRELRFITNYIDENLKINCLIPAANMDNHYLQPIYQ